MHNKGCYVILFVIKIDLGEWVETHFFVVKNISYFNKGNIGGLIPE